MSEPLVPASTVAAQSLESTTPQERLANSRKALVHHMTRHQPAPSAGKAHVSLNTGDTGNTGNTENFSERHFDPQNAQGNSTKENAKRQNRNSSLPGSLGILRQVLVSWWSRHPANMAVDIARPVLSHYAEKRPFRILAVAAVVGAAVVLVKPWRLVTPGAVVLGALKSSGLSHSLLSLLSGFGRK